MVRLTLDEPLLRQLRDIKQRVEVTDHEGHIVGYFEPSSSFGQRPAPEPSEEELIESERDPVSYSLEEVWERIHRGDPL